MQTYLPFGGINGHIFNFDDHFIRSWIALVGAWSDLEWLRVCGGLPCGLVVELGAHGYCEFISVCLYSRVCSAVGFGNDEIIVVDVVCRWIRTVEPLSSMLYVVSTSSMLDLGLQTQCFALGILSEIGCFFLPLETGV